MSEENVEMVRAWFEVWNAPDGDLDELRRFFDPAVVVIPPDGWPEGPARGIDAWKRQAESLRKTWAQARMEIDEIYAAGDDRVVSHMRYLTHGNDDSIAFETQISAVFFFTERRVTRALYFWDKAEALEATGLSE